MNAQDWINKYKNFGERLRSSRILFFAATETMDQMQERIWKRGELTDGGKLSYKENYEVYIYKPPFPQSPNGKGKTGRKIKGQWAPTYLAAKASQGREDLPFELTGDMRIGWLGGPQPTPSELSPLRVVITMPQKDWEKAVGLEKTKGDFLGLTRSEKAFHDAALVRLAQRLI